MVCIKEFQFKPFRKCNYNISCIAFSNKDKSLFKEDFEIELPSSIFSFSFTIKDCFKTFCLNEYNHQEIQEITKEDLIKWLEKSINIEEGEIIIKTNKNYYHFQVFSLFNVSYISYLDCRGSWEGFYLSDFLDTIRSIVFPNPPYAPSDLEAFEDSIAVDPYFVLYRKDGEEYSKIIPYSSEPSKISLGGDGDLLIYPKNNFALSIQ